MLIDGFCEVLFIRPKSGPEMTDLWGLAGPGGPGGLCSHLLKGSPARPQTSTIPGPEFGRIKNFPEFGLIKNLINEQTTTVTSKQDKEI